MCYFISGGCKNGKSTYAQDLAIKISKEKNLPLYYLATMIPHDREDDARIARHISERAGLGFDTIECGIDVLDAFNMKAESGNSVDKNGVFLFDSVTALLSNEMFKDGDIIEDAPQKVLNDLLEFSDIAPNTIFVSDFIYSDSACYDALTEKYRKGLAQIDRGLAQKAKEVLEVSFGSVIKHK